jgi:asparagine synthase (glutamine-hydrolysing)
MVHRPPLEAMRDAMRHRGPDDAGLHWSADGRVALAHRRLSIIDLSPLGHQPMADPSGELWIVFNGEIYNYRELKAELAGLGHRFRSASDTEVILEAYRRWGLECLSRLNGMFAFALYDAPARRLFLARDRAGEKPLFYSHAQGRLTFASELKAMMADGSLERRLDLASLDFYLAYGYVPHDRCILRGVHKLPQAHAMTYELETDRLSSWRYWRLPEPTGRAGASDEELSEELERLLADSVRMRLIADVPVGILLSGGLDSSLVTAAAAEVSSSPLKTFTVSFPGHGEYDEGPYARLVADYLGTEHVELVAEPATVELLPELARQYDEPIADHSMVPTYLVSKQIRTGATVALGGDGGDELFGGYPYYSWLGTIEKWRRRLPSWLRRLGGRMAGHVPMGLRGRNYLIGFSGDNAWGIAHANMHFDEAWRRKLLAPVLPEGIEDAEAPERFKAGLCRADRSLLANATAADFQSYLVDDILVKVDRASMLCSLEVRAPWLDHRIVELAFGRVPDRLRAGQAGRKVLPRTLGERMLPPNMDLRRKRGFMIPLARWLGGQWGGFIQDVLCNAEPRIFDRAAVEGLLAGQRRGLVNEHRLFALAMFELWRREYQVEV